MPRKIAPLSDIECRNAKPREKLYKMADGGGLYLEVSPTGGKHWRMKYYFGGKEKLLTIGPYPRIGLAAARKSREAAKDQIDAGLDPSGERKAQRLTAKLAANTTFEGVTREWFEREKQTWVESHGTRILRRFERDIFPHIGNRPIAALTTPEVLAVLRKIEERGAVETAHRAKWDCSQVFLYAIETGRAERNPVETMSRGALKLPATRNHAAIIDPQAIGQLMRAIRGYKGSQIVRAALQLAPLVFLRPGELRQAQWIEFDLDGTGRFGGTGPMWEVPNERMKRPKEEKQLSGGHLVPLSRQAEQILRELQLLTGGGRYLFPSPRTRERPLSDNGVLSALRRMGYTGEEMTGHGFRAMARTALAERVRVDERFIELQLAHAVRDSNGRAYNRASFLEERTQMMQDWADYLDGLAAGATVLPLQQAAA